MSGRDPIESPVPPEALPVSLLLLLMSIAWLTLAGAASATVCQTGPQTLSQMPSGKSSGPLTVPVRGLRAYLTNGKVWRRVAIQIDERDANGDYVLEHGLPFTADGGDSRFNNKDELVIDLPENFSDAQQFTDRAAAEWLKKLQRETTRRNIPAEKSLRSWRVDLSAGTKKAQVLFVTGLPVADLPDAVLFDTRLQTVHTSAYRYRFNERNPAAMGRLEIPSGTEKKDDFITINQEGGFAIWLKPPWGFPVISQSNKDLSGAIESWRSGPVRTIVAVGSKYSAFWSLVKAHLFSELVFYRTRFQIPSVVDIPFSPDKLLGSGSGFAYGLQLSGNVTPKVERTDDGPARVSVEHPAGLVLSATLDRDLAQSGTLPHVWQAEDQDDKAGIPGEVIRWFRKNGATTGFFVDISHMGRGRYDFSLDLESRGKANQDHTDFVSCESVWTPVAPTQTVGPAQKKK